MSIFCPFDCTSAAEIPSCTYVMIPYDFLVDVGVCSSVVRCPKPPALFSVTCSWRRCRYVDYLGSWAALCQQTRLLHDPGERNSRGSCTSALKGRLVHVCRGAESPPHTPKDRTLSGSSTCWFMTPGREREQAGRGFDSGRLAGGPL